MISPMNQNIVLLKHGARKKSRILMYGSKLKNSLNQNSLKFQQNARTG
jgi:hypothetical protein